MMHFIYYYESHYGAWLQCVRNQINKPFEILVRVEKMNDPLLVKTYYIAQLFSNSLFLINWTRTNELSAHRSSKNNF